MKTNFNFKMAEQVLELIRKNPKIHDQYYWFVHSSSIENECNTIGCIAGWINCINNYPDIEANTINSRRFKPLLSDFALTTHNWQTEAAQILQPLETHETSWITQSIYDIFALADQEETVKQFMFLIKEVKRFEELEDSLCLAASTYLKSNNTLDNFEENYVGLFPSIKQALYEIDPDGERYKEDILELEKDFKFLPHPFASDILFAFRV